MLAAQRARSRSSSSLLGVSPTATTAPPAPPAPAPAATPPAAPTTATAAGGNSSNSNSQEQLPSPPPPKRPRRHSICTTDPQREALMMMSSSRNGNNVNNSSGSSDGGGVGFGDFSGSGNSNYTSAGSTSLSAIDVALLTPVLALRRLERPGVKIAEDGGVGGGSSSSSSSSAAANDSDLLSPGGSRRKPTWPVHEPSSELLRLLEIRMHESKSPALAPSTPDTAVVGAPAVLTDGSTSSVRLISPPPPPRTESASSTEDSGGADGADEDMDTGDDYDGTNSSRTTDTPPIVAPHPVAAAIGSLAAKVAEKLADQAQEQDYQQKITIEFVPLNDNHMAESSDAADADDESEDDDENDMVDDSSSSSSMATTSNENISRVGLPQWSNAQLAKRLLKVHTTASAPSSTRNSPNGGGPASACAVERSSSDSDPGSPRIHRRVTFTPHAAVHILHETQYPVPTANPKKYPTTQTMTRSVPPVAFAYQERDILKKLKQLLTKYQITYADLMRLALGRFSLSEELPPFIEDFMNWVMRYRSIDPSTQEQTRLNWMDRRWLLPIIESTWGVQFKYFPNLYL